MTAARQFAAIMAIDVGVREHRDGTSENRATAASHLEIGRGQNSTTAGSSRSNTGCPCEEPGVCEDVTHASRRRAHPVRRS